MQFGLFTLFDFFPDRQEESGYSLTTSHKFYETYEL